MHSKFISRLRAASWTVIVLGLLVFGYLLLSAAATQIVRDREEVLASIEASTNIVELKAEASGLALLGSGASQISMALLWIAMLSLLFLAALAVLSLHWIRRLERVINEKPPQA